MAWLIKFITCPECFKLVVQIIAKAIGRITRQKVRIVLNQNFQPRTGQNNGELNSVAFRRGVNLGFSCLDRKFSRRPEHQVQNLQIRIMQLPKKRHWGLLKPIHETKFVLSTRMAIPDLASIAVTSLVAFLSRSALGFPSKVGHACPMARFE